MIGGMGRPVALCMLMGRQCDFGRLLWRCTLVLVKEKGIRCTCVLEVVVLEVCLHQAGGLVPKQCGPVQVLPVTGVGLSVGQ